MPWCQNCNRFFNPNTLLPGGTCPNCGSQAEASALRGASQRTAGASAGAETVPQRVPWHFKLMVVATVVYVGWRIVEIVGQVVS